jgi:hypothetical protein
MRHKARFRLRCHKTLIAIANKHARVLWAMLSKGERYDADVWQRHPMRPPLPPAAESNIVGSAQTNLPSERRGRFSSNDDERIDGQCCRCF